MKTKIILAIMALSLSLIGLMSCGEDAENSVAGDSVAARQQMINNIQNVNPLEWVGVFHNDVLNNYVDNLEKSYSNNEWKDINLKSDDFKKKFCEIMDQSYDMSCSEIASTPEIQEKMYDLMQFKEWFSDDLYQFDLAVKVLEEQASTKDKNYTIHLLSDLLNAVQNPTDDQTSMDNIGNIIAEHEALILSQTWTDDETFALGALAVVKHSHQLWSNYDWSIFDNNVVSFKSGLTDKVKRASQKVEDGAAVAADGIGYVVGGVIGATSGVVLSAPLVGTCTIPAGVTGFVVGKAAGAVLASGGVITAIAIYNSFCGFFSGD